MSVALAIVDAGLLPQVEDPIPDSIGFDVPFTTAGWGAVAAVVIGGDTAAERERRIRWCTTAGLFIGTLILLAAVAAQVL